MVAAPLSSQGPNMERILEGMKTRMAERQEAIDQNNRKGEQTADQNMVEDLRGAAAACPSQSPGPEVKQKLDTIATQYEQTKSRYERDRIMLNFATKVLMIVGVPFLTLLADLSIKAIAPEATMVMDGDETIDGYSIEGDHGTHKFLYDADHDGTLDHEVEVDDDTDEQIGESEVLGLKDYFVDIFESISNHF